MIAEEHLPIDFLAVGEAVVDLISTGIVSSLRDANSFQRFLGGEVTNLAMNMARLGHRSALGVCVGQDGFGEFLTARLGEAGVIQDYVQSSPDRPTTMIAVARQTQTPDFIVYRGADTQLTPAEALVKAAQHSRAIHTSAFSLSRNPARETILTLLEKAHEQGALISLDPNYHPRIYPDRQDFTSFLKEIYPFVQVTKPSLDDGVRLFGSGYTPWEYVEFFLDLGAGFVVLTMGGEGVLLATAEEERYRLQPNPISVVDVTGAGDAFWSGLLSGLLSGSSPLEAARLGQIVAEFKIGMVGPVVAFPNLESLKEKASMIQVSRPV
jgi:fructokinase